MKNNLTWKELVLRQPKLEELYQEALAWEKKQDPKHFCANSVWYGLPNSMKHLP